MKNSITDPLPKTIREFKYRWLKPEFMSYSDKDIKKFLKKILENDKKYISINL